MSLLYRICRAVGIIGFTVFIVAGCDKRANVKDEREAICQQGDKFLNAGDYQHAIETYSQLLTSNPGASQLKNEHYDYYFDPWALYSRGLAYAGSGALDNAIRDWSYLIHWQPENSDALIQRGQAYQKKKFLDLALQDFSSAIRTHSDNADAYLHRASVYKELGSFSYAIVDCAKSISLQPDNSHAYSIRGEAYLALEDYEHAVDNLKQCLLQGGDAKVVNPLLSTACFKWSKELTAAGDTAKAVELLAQAQKLDPNLRVQPKQPDAPPAVKKQQLVAKLLPSGEIVAESSADGYMCSGDDFFEIQDYATAHDEYTHAIELDPNRAEAYEKRARNWLARGFGEDALTDVLFALRVGGYTQDRYLLKAKAELAKKYYYDAADTASVIMRQGPVNAEAFSIRGAAYLHRKMFDEAIRDLRFAVAEDRQLESPLQPLLAEAYYRRGKLNEADGKAKEAKADLVQAAAYGWVTEGGALGRN